MPEAATFRARATADRLAAAWLLSLAGLRRSEVLGLRWEDVDLEAGTVTIARGRVAVTATMDAVDDPKSKRSARTLPVGDLPGVTAALRALRKRQAEERLALGAAYGPGGFLVVDEMGRPPRPEAYSDAFRRLCREAGVPSIRLHETRHTLVTTLRAAGLPDDEIAKWLGHSVAVMLSTYARALPGSNERTGSAIAAAWAASGS